MKAGLFICDHVNSDLQPEFGDYSDMFYRLFPEYQWALYDVSNGHFPDNLQQCDVYFATGSRRSVYENVEWIFRLKESVRGLSRRNIPFIGFCFGHQLLAEALGGKVDRSPNGWCVGVHQFNILQQQSWMLPPQDPLNLLMMCQDQVVQLPEGAVILAGNAKCPIGMFQVGDNMLGIQAHPEFVPEYDRLLMELRVGRIGEEVVREGIDSLSKQVDSALFGDWIRQFLKQLP